MTYRDKEYQNSASVAYGAFILLMLAVAAYFVFSSNPRVYADSRPFVGCYRDAEHTVRLTSTSRLIVDGRDNGSFRIIAPVGGKHGYLLDAPTLFIEGQGSDLVIRSSTKGGYTLPINKAGGLTIFNLSGTTFAFAPAPCLG